MKMKLDLIIDLSDYAFDDKKDEEKWLNQVITAKNLRLEDNEFCEELKIARIAKKKIIL